MLKAKRINKTRYVKVGDDMTWPMADQEDLEWRCRYSPELERSDRMKLASIVSAYNTLINHTNKRRNEIANALKSVEL